MESYVNFDDDDSYDDEFLPLEKISPPQTPNPYIAASSNEILTRLPSLVKSSIDTLESLLTCHDRGDRLKAANAILRLAETAIKMQQKA